MKVWDPEAIRKLRKRYGLSQRAFSELLGVTEQHIYYLERGVRIPSKTLERLLDCVGEKLRVKEKGKEAKKSGERHL